MRALRYEGSVQGVALARTAPEPDVHPGEALIRPLRMAIGFADRRIAAAKPDLPPITLGREFVGVVEKVVPIKPTREKHPLLGRRVVATTTISCGECDLCQRGLAAHCRARAVLGVAGRDGCFADRFVLPLRNLHAVPTEVDDDSAALADPLAAAIQCLQQLRIEGKPYITVLGDGCIGLLCAQIMNRLNASVRIVGTNESRLDLAAKWSVKHRLSRDVGRRADQDIVVDCTGSAEGLDLAMKLVRPRGKILLKGPVHAALGDRWSIDLTPIAAHEIELLGSRCGPIAEALDTLRRREVDVVSLITKRARLDDALAAIAAADRPEHIKVVLDP
jgi:threonine dehydrogenase-like Zn-dependent dehydrogenase